MEADTLRMGRTRSILARLNLNPEHLGTVAGLRNKSAYAPYHNFQHLLTVAKYSYEMGLFYSVPEGELRLLVLAALYHDFNHLAGNTADELNIAEAVAAAKIYVPKLEPDFSEEEVNQIIALIESTLNTNSTPAESLLEGILRDADLLQSLENDRSVFWYGLAEETGRTVDEEETKKFLLSRNFHTDWADEAVKSFLLTLG